MIPSKRKVAATQVHRYSNPRTWDLAKHGLKATQAQSQDHAQAIAAPSAKRKG